MPRTKGATDIPKRKKARILAKKNVQELTVVEIAKQECVCRNSVIAIKNSTVPPDVLAMAERYQHQYLAYSDANAMKGAQKTFESIDDLTADKAAAVSEKFFNIGRTIRGEATTNVQQSTEWTDLDFAKELLTRLVGEYGWTAETAVERILRKYPEIDVKMLTEGE